MVKPSLRQRLSPTLLPGAREADSIFMKTIVETSKNQLSPASLVSVGSVMPLMLLFGKLPLPEDIHKSLTNPALKGAVTSAYITKMDGTVLYELNPSQPVIPASNEKLLTATYALGKLGADYQPQTRFWKFSDKLVVETTGDPMLTYQQLEDAKTRLALTGDLPVFVKEPYRPGIPPGWKKDYLGNKYAAPVTAFTVDRGSFEIWAGKKHVFYMPRAYKAQVVHTPGKGLHVSFDRDTQTAKVTGTLPEEITRLDTLALKEPDVDAASILGTGFNLIETTPTTAPDLVIQGPMLADIVKECLVKSDNNIAEHLLLLSALGDGPLGESPYEVAPVRMKEFLVKAVGIDPADLEPHDGSGLGRWNKITTRALAKLLLWNEQQPTKDLWRASLASPGNGTLKKRLEGSEFVGKTGTLDGVVSLSGYAMTRDKTPVILSVVMNHHRCSNNTARSIADEIVRKIEASDLSGTVIDVGSKRESPATLTKPGIVPLNRLY